jgi:hypothetical protein
MAPADKPMASDFVRFMIDAEIHAKAVKACAELDLELSDVLRSLVIRIARDGPESLNIGSPTARPQTGAMPFQDYDARWRPLKRELDADVAFALVTRVIAERLAAIDEESTQRTPDQAVLARWATELDEARRMRSELHQGDPDAVARIADKYGTGGLKGAG